MDYYKTIYSAESSFLDKDYLNASQKYDSAFHKVKYVFVKDLVNAAIVNSLVKKDSTFYHYLIKAFCQGWTLEEFKRNKYLYNYNDSITIKLISKIDSCNKLYYKSFNNEVRIKLSNLLANDQNVRKNNLLSNIFPSLNYTPKKIKKRRIIDSLNAVKLHTIIKKYGFPGEKLIGYSPIFDSSSTHILHILLLHDDPRNGFYEDSLLRNAIIKGNLSPYTYAARHDRYFANYNPMKLLKKERTNLKAYYIYSNCSSIKDTTLINKINNFRNEIGLRTIDLDNKIINYIRQGNKYLFNFNRW